MFIGGRLKIQYKTLQGIFQWWKSSKEILYNLLHADENYVSIRIRNEFPIGLKLSGIEYGHSLKLNS